MTAYAEVELLGIGADSTGDAVMVLGEVGGGRRAVPIWIGEHEARAIERVVHGEPSPHRPAHEALVDMVRARGRDVGAVTLHASGAPTAADAFVADVVLDDGSLLPSRPGDAVPVALVSGRPIHVRLTDLERAAVPVEYTAEVATGRPPPPGSPTEAEIDAQAGALRRWLDTATVADLAGTGPRGEREADGNGPTG